MEDYKEIIKELLLRDFSTERQANVLQMSTYNVLKMVRGIIPETPIDEHDIFEVLKAAGFQYELCEIETLSEEDVLINYVYHWNLYKK